MHFNRCFQKNQHSFALIFYRFKAKASSLLPYFRKNAADGRFFAVPRLIIGLLPKFSLLRIITVSRFRKGGTCLKTISQSGVITADLHGKNTYQAGVTVDALLRRAGSGTYRLRLIHGHHGGTAIRDFLRDTYARHPRVLRITVSPDGEEAPREGTRVAYG